MQKPLGKEINLIHDSPFIFSPHLFYKVAIDWKAIDCARAAVSEGRVGWFS